MSVGGSGPMALSMTEHRVVPLGEAHRREAVAALSALLAQWWAEHPTHCAFADGQDGSRAEPENSVDPRSVPEVAASVGVISLRS